ncbi:MAG: hypothetical protein ACO1Q7_00160 [Gemmatimonas sp.]
MPTLINPKSNNWIDRGESPIRVMRTTLSHYFEKFDVADGPWLTEQATVVFGMVAADCTDVQVAGYLRGVVRELGLDPHERLGSRMFAVSLWHIAKAAIVRDFAERVLSGVIPKNDPTPEPLGKWLEERLMRDERISDEEGEVGN